MSDSSSGEMARFCPQCGALLRAGASFCTACGAAAGAALPASAASPARQAAPARPRWLPVAVVLALVAVAALVWALLNDARPPAGGAVTVPTAPAAAQDAPYPNVARVSPEQAHMSAMAGNALIVDVRGQEYYATAHARGAISIPLEQLPARLGELPRDKAVLFYCT